MHSKFRAHLTRRLSPQSADDDTLFEIELYYLIRECINRVDPARVADIGENGYQTGVSEYGEEAYSIFLEVLAHYQRGTQLSKEGLHRFVRELFERMFYPGVFKGYQSQTIAQSIYNEIYKIDPGNRLNHLRMKISRYSLPVTNTEEYCRYIDSRGAFQSN